jgi:serine/threonine-protein kinase
MALTVGSRLGHYDVTALIGEGGMGQVYQATDTKLNRQVALKILPEAFASDPDRLARFQREAQVLASLNHPNIAQIHGLEESDTTRALVLELVEGPTLVARISQGPIPVDEALPIAKQIAEALEAAHEAGVIHRDLKPANIKVRDDGTVKVLDFGLAKALDTAPEGDPSLSPTLTAAATQMGVIMGTAAYMSPEQARGKPVDKRADIWAFGVVLFEMLTGQRAFAGEDVSVTLADVIRADLSWDTLPSDLPPGLATYLRRCLEKEPSQRIQAIGDVRLAMEGAFETTVVATPEPAIVQRLRLWQRPLSVAMIVIAAVALGGLVVWTLTRPAAQPLARFTISLEGESRLPPNPGPAFALSPDGQKLVYAAFSDGSQQLYVRSLDQIEAIPLRGTDGGQNVFWSPNGEWVGFKADGMLKKVALAGGAPETLCEAEGLPGGASWGLNDAIVFSGGPGSPLLRVSALGGIPEPLTSLRPDEGDVAHLWPQVLPGGNAVVFTVFRSSESDSSIAVRSLSGEEHRVLLAGTGARYVSTGHLVFVRENTLWVVPFDAEGLEVTGPASPVLENVLRTPGGIAQFSFASNGSLVYAPGDVIGARLSTLVWVDRNGQATELAAEAGPYRYPRVSPDGTRVAVSRTDQQSDVWIWDVGGETLTRLTSDPGVDQYGEWTPDGNRVVFRSNREGGNSLFWRSTDFTGDAERLTRLKSFSILNPSRPTGASSFGNRQ